MSRHDRIPLRAWLLKVARQRRTDVPPTSALRVTSRYAELVATVSVVRTSDDGVATVWNFGCLAAHQSASSVLVPGFTDGDDSCWRDGVRDVAATQNVALYWCKAAFPANQRNLHKGRPERPLGAIGRIIMLHCTNFPSTL